MEGHKRECSLLYIYLYIHKKRRKKENHFIVKLNGKVKIKTYIT